MIRETLYDSNKFYNLVKALGSLKNQTRLGWLIEGIPKSIAEDVAQHSFEATIYALIIGYELEKKGENIKKDKLLSMTLLHDLAEAFVGDVVKYLKDRIGGLKEQIEFEAIREQIKIDYIVNIYKEYIEGDSIEAKIARLADLLATYVQAKRYYNQGYKHVERILINIYNSIINIIRKDLPQAKDVIYEVIHSVN